MESCNLSVFTPQAGCCSCHFYAEQKCLQIRPSSILSGCFRHSSLTTDTTVTGSFVTPLTLPSACVCTVTRALLISLCAVLISSSSLGGSAQQFAGLIAAAAGMNRWSWGNAGNACKSDRSGPHRGGRLMMLLWIILSSSLCLMVDGQMKISPET